jgi:hypothetical protein
MEWRRELLLVTWSGCIIVKVSGDDEQVKEEEEPVEGGKRGLFKSRHRGRSRRWAKNWWRKLSLDRRARPGTHVWTSCNLLGGSCGLDSVGVGKYIVQTSLGTPSTRYRQG